MAIQKSDEIFTPSESCAATGRVPSAFMRTTDQFPDSTDQVTDCAPEPSAFAAQNVWSPGGPEGAPPVVVVERIRNGS